MNLYMYKVSFTPMLIYLSVDEDLEYLWYVIHGTNPAETNVGSYCCIITYSVREKGTFASK